MSALGAQRPASGRVELARLGEKVIALTGGLRGTSGAAGLWMTADGDHAVTGIIAVEDATGRVELELHLVAVWPPEPLASLGEELRGRLRRSAERAGLADRLGTVQITFHDVVLPEEEVPR